MYERDIVRIRELLLKQRNEIFERLRRLESDWKVLEERDIELEEESQKTDITTLYDQLDEREKMQIEEIDLSLCRIAAGSYGVCESCQKLISLKRLEVLPATRLCRKCAHRYEEEQKRLPRAEEVIVCEELPSEYKGLPSEQLRLLIFEHLRNDGRVDVEELKIFCKNKIIYLEGIVPSEKEHQILLRILRDIMGFTSIVDHLQTTELIWEREDRSPGRADYTPSVDVDEITDDVFESQEKEIPYMFPDQPPPEEE
ncbi:MAG: TraR/DksA C4-type zinc finger protein [Desulfobacterales bacterium]|nr:TraR/DksA C4-type zinc finger protein [Desulfobacterales bacterium]